MRQNDGIKHRTANDSQRSPERRNASILYKIFSAHFSVKLLWVVVGSKGAKHFKHARERLALPQLEPGEHGLALQRRFLQAHISSLLALTVQGLHGSGQVNGRTCDSP